MTYQVLALLSKFDLPSARIRIRNMAPFLKNQNINLKTEPFAKSFSRLIQILSLPKYDVVIIQKKTSLRKLELYLIRKLSRRIIYDFDDASMFHELEHSKPLAGKNFKKFIKLFTNCRMWFIKLFYNGKIWWKKREKGPKNFEI